MSGSGRPVCLARAGARTQPVTSTITSTKPLGSGAQNQEAPVAVSPTLQVADNAPIFQSYADFKWDKILPDLDADSPGINM